MQTLGVAEILAPSSLANVAGISVPYASQILTGARTPRRALAIHIYRQTGWRHPSIADLTEEQIDTLEAVDRYEPRSANAGLSDPAPAE